MVSPSPSKDQPAIRLDGVSFSYGRVPALENVTFCIPQGELTYVVGPSAAGKKNRPLEESGSGFLIRGNGQSGGSNSNQLFGATLGPLK